MPTPAARLAMLSVHTCPFAALGGKQTGGMNVYIRELSRALAQLGVEVDIFTRCEAQDTQEVKRLGSLTKVIHVESGPPRTLPPMEIYPYLGEFTQNVLRYQQKHRRHYQLIHAHYWLSGLVALSLRDKLSLPVLQSFHTLGKVKQRFFPHPPEPKVRLLAEERLAVTADALLASTAEEQDLLQRLYQARPDNISVVPPGVDVLRFRPQPKRSAKTKIGVAQASRVILFVGRLDPIKGLETLLQAITILKRGKASLRDLALVVIGGEGEERYFTMIKKKARALGIGELTSFLGSRQQRLLPRYYSAAEITVIPSSHESFGLVALESMACATPVIASDVGGLGQLITHGKTGWLVPPDQPQALAQAMTWMLTDPDRREAIARRAQQTAQRYSWKRVTPRVLRIYQRILDHQDQPRKT